MKLVSDVIGDLLAVYMDAGIRGIAVASVAAYLCACLVLGGQLVSGKTIFRLGRPRMLKGMLTAVLITGFPMAVRFLSEFIYPIAVNRMMLRYGSINGLAALSIQDAMRYMPLALGEGMMTATLLLTGMFAAEHDTEALRRERRDILRCCTVNGSALAIVLAAAAPLLVKLFKMNPMYYIVYGYRDSLIWHVPFWKHPLLTLYFWLFTAVVYWWGTRTFRRSRGHFADVL